MYIYMGGGKTISETDMIAGNLTHTSVWHPYMFGISSWFLKKETNTIYNSLLSSWRKHVFFQKQRGEWFQHNRSHGSHFGRPCCHMFSNRKGWEIESKVNHHRCTCNPRMFSFKLKLGKYRNWTHHMFRNSSTVAPWLDTVFFFHGCTMVAACCALKRTPGQKRHRCHPLSICTPVGWISKRFMFSHWSRLWYLLAYPLWLSLQSVFSRNHCAPAAVLGKERSQVVFWPWRKSPCLHPWKHGKASAS